MGTITREYLITIVRNSMEAQQLWKNGAKYGLFDNRYHPTNINDLQNYYKLIKFPTYADDSFDCEDFAYTCKVEISLLVRQFQNSGVNWAFGLAFGQFQWMENGKIDHACNWFVDENHEVKWLEPQNGKIYTLDYCSQGSLRLLLV